MEAVHALRRAVRGQQGGGEDVSGGQGGAAATESAGCQALWVGRVTRLRLMPRLATHVQRARVPPVRVFHTTYSKQTGIAGTRHGH